MKLPLSFLNSLQHIKGFNKETFEEVHNSNQQITSIRINTQKPTVLDTNEKIPWSTSGYYLNERPSFTLDPLFHAGAYYVQEASSMFLEQAITQSTDIAQPIKVLDLCAAPGGKSTLIQSIISSKSLLVSNEVIKTRVNVLSENITKWGAPNVIVTNNDPKDFQRLQNYFDVIVVDAPCSGSGLFRKDESAINEWGEQNVQLCSQRQQRILADSISSLKDNSVLIYSTCSYSKEEDEEITDWLLQNYQLSSVNYQLKEEWGIVETTSPLKNGYGYRFYPDKLKGEGFFLAAFKKAAGILNHENERPLKVKSEKLSAKETAVVKPYLKAPDNFFFIKQNDETIAIPIHLENDLATIQSSLYIKKAGVKMGTIIRDELIPDHELAVSTIINKTIPSVEVDKETALQYLRRHEIKIDMVYKGWTLLTHHQLPLGWIKVLPNRVNNYYPANWRILNK